MTAPRPMRSPWSPAALGLLFLACAPPPISAEDDEAGASGGSDSEGGSTTSGGTSSSSSDTDTDTDTDTGLAFVPNSDVSCGGGGCDPWRQYCPEGEKCVAYASSGGAWDATKCVPVLGEQMPGEACTWDGIVEATDDCDASGYCWDVMEVGGELVGTCVEFCGGTPDLPICPDIPGCASQGCLVGGEGSINLCVPSCDPLMQDCSEGLGCFWVQGRFECTFTTSDIPEGEPCGFVNDCQPGNLCLEAASLPECAGESCCTPFCDTADDFDPCPDWQPGTACLPFDTGQDDCSIGICRLP